MQLHRRNTILWMQSHRLVHQTARAGARQLFIKTGCGMLHCAIWSPVPGLQSDMTHPARHGFGSGQRRSAGMTSAMAPVGISPIFEIASFSCPCRDARIPETTETIAMGGGLAVETSTERGALLILAQPIWPARIDDRDLHRRWRPSGQAEGGPAWLIFHMAPPLYAVEEMIHARDLRARPVHKSGVPNASCDISHVMLYAL